MSTLIVGNSIIEYSIRKSTKAKRLSFVITPHNVELVTPVEVDENRMLEFIERKKNWVFRKLHEVNELSDNHQTTKPFGYRSGAKILFRGRMLKLYVIESDLAEAMVSYRNGFYVSVPKRENPSKQQGLVKAALEDWMKAKVNMDIKSFINTYSKKLQLTPKSYRIKAQKHLWGSCGKDNIVNINWNLIQAPKQILEYVVVHELCHLKYRNHSDAFWTLVGSVFPEVDRCKEWLESTKEWDL